MKENKILVILKDYKNSIKWNLLLAYYTIFTITHLIIKCNWIRFFGITGTFFILTLIIWLMHKLNNRTYKTKLK